MFLATHLLRKSERAAAFAECPCGEEARLNWNIALNLVRNDFLEAFDLFFKSTYLHEALCALTDGALLFNRAVANVRESKAASLYRARRQPLGWLEVPTPVLDSEEDRRLRHAVEEMPLHAAAADLNDGLNQVANGIVRLAWEINIPAAELKQFHLDGSPTSKWISWGHLAGAIRDADPATKVLPHLGLVQALLKCVDDPSFEFEYRHSRTHRAFPATHQQPYTSVAGVCQGFKHMSEGKPWWVIAWDFAGPLATTIKVLAGAVKIFATLAVKLKEGASLWKSAKQAVQAGVKDFNVKLIGDELGKLLDTSRVYKVSDAVGDVLTWLDLFYKSVTEPTADTFPIQPPAPAPALQGCPS